MNNNPQTYGLPTVVIEQHQDLNSANARQAILNTFESKIKLIDRKSTIDRIVAKLNQLQS